MVENGAAERAPPNPAHYKQLPRKIRALAPPTLDLKQKMLRKRFATPGFAARPRILFPT